MRAKIERFYCGVVSSKKFWIPLLFIAIISYGFSIMNRTIGIDDLSRKTYFMPSEFCEYFTRWGKVVYIRMFSTMNLSPFIDRFMALVFLILAGIALSFLFYILLGEDAYVWKYTVFSCVFVSYPLINELWEYSDGNMTVGINYLLIALTLIFQSQIREWNIRNVIVAAIPLTFVMASFESGAFAYVTLVILWLVIRIARNRQIQSISWFKDGIFCAISLVLALLFRTIIGTILVNIYKVPYTVGGATELAWGKESFSVILENWFKNIKMYGAQMLVYFPIAIFVIAVLGFICLDICTGRTLQRQKGVFYFLSIISIISLFFQSIIQGYYMPYRTAAGIQIFVAFVPLWYLDYIKECVDNCQERAKRRRYEICRSVGVIIFLFLAFRQSVYLNSLLALNNQRSDNEAAIVHEIGYRLYSEYDSNKPVVFTGSIDLGEFINSQITDSEQPLWPIKKALKPIIGLSTTPKKFVMTNVRSGVDWSARAFNSQIMLKKYFSYYGYDINVIEEATPQKRGEYYQLAIEEQMKPLEIRDMGDYVLVFLGENK